MKKTWGAILTVLFIAGLTIGCSAGLEKNSFDITNDITVVSREDGSGTRGAFIELFGVEERGADGSRRDKTVKSAIIASKTDVMMVNIANDPHAIGYISMGSMNDTIKALNIDGIIASSNNVKNGAYTVYRPFNIVIKSDPGGLAKDFIDFILSAEGQKVASNAYTAIDDDAPAYTGEKPGGKIVVAGSSSVSPLMELLKEAYEVVNQNAHIEIQTSDSTAGITAVNNGTCDVGMASRGLKPSEMETLTETSIALDGIAIIVNKSNPTENLSIEQVRAIFTGEITKWNGLEN